MAKLLTEIQNFTEYPQSFRRQGAFPLDLYSIFETFAAAKEYAENSETAYVGQPIAVTEHPTTYYVIANQAGDLFKLGDSALDINEIDRRLKAEAETRANAIDELKSDTTTKLNAEAVSRSENDELLQIKLDDETAIREEEIATLRAALFEEVETARAAENSLSQKLTTEERARANEDLLIRVELNNEKQERQEANTELHATLKELSEALADEQKRINVNEDKWSRDQDTQYIFNIDGPALTITETTYVNGEGEAKAPISFTTISEQQVINLIEQYTPIMEENFIHNLFK